MGKGKKKAKGKKMSGGKKVTEDNSANDSPRRFQPSQEQVQMAIMATANRTEDPLKNWTRIQNEECPICMLPLPLRGSDINIIVLPVVKLYVWAA